MNITGTSSGETLTGTGGDDVIDGLGGDDILIGGLGADQLIGGLGIDTASYEFDPGAVFINLRAGQGFGNSAQGDTYSGIENLIGTQFNDFLIGDDAVNRIDGSGGDDILLGGLGGDVLVGGSGSDTASYEDNWGPVFVNLRAGVGFGNAAQGDVYQSIENLTGGLFNDFFIGDDFVNRIDGGGGDDILLGGLGGDLLIGGTGSNTASYEDNWGAVFVNLTTGQGFNNAAEGDSYTQIQNLQGGIFNDFFIGDANANRLAGGSGNDTLIGAGGADIFVFDSALGAGVLGTGNVDTITDFVVGVDKIQLGGGAGEPFAALASGALADTALFTIGSGTQRTEDVILYDSATGALSYDADGNGAGAAVQFATLSTGLNLTGSSFIVSGPANQAPQVTSGTTASVAENSPASTIVYQAAATDADGDRITWSLGGADASAFTIDANGAVRLNAPANFEAKSSYDFVVFASDSGTSPGSKAVTLGITDVAETISTPIFNETAAPNDTTGSAQTIDAGALVVAANPYLPDQTLPSGTIVGSISNHADVDYYGIFLKAGELLVLDVDFTTNLDAHVFLYSQGGVLVIDNDDADSLDPGSSIHFGHNTDSYIRVRAPTDGFYYFKIEAFQGDQQDTFGDYKINVSVGPVATAAQITNENIDALLSGDKWNDLSLTYGFPQLASQYPNDAQGDRFEEIDQLNPALPNFDNFEGFNSTQIGATQQLLQMIASVSQLTFAPNSFAPGQADLRYAMSDEADVAYAYYPTNAGPSSVGGTAWFRNSPFEGRSTPAWDNPIKGSYSWMGILHETGHALGLKHGHEAPAVSPSKDSIEYTVMTYRSYIGGDLNGYSNETFGYAQTLMQYDIAALQRMYGANFNTNAGDSVYSWNPNSGEMTINSVGQGAPGDGSANGNRVFMTLWDGGGNDTYDLSNYFNIVTIDLRPGEWTRTSDVQIADLGDGHFAHGNVANALLYNDDPRSLIENAIAGPNNDVLIANQAANHLTGGGGSDTFKWMASGDAGTGALADTVTDFVRGADRIGLFDIDANPGSEGNDTFSFIGTAAFHNLPGEVRYDVIGGNAHVFADVDGNGIVDMEIIVNNNTILSGSDFFL